MASLGQRICSIVIYITNNCSRWQYGWKSSIFWLLRSTIPTIQKTTLATTDIQSYTITMSWLLISSIKLCHILVRWVRRWSFTPSLSRSFPFPDHRYFIRRTWWYQWFIFFFNGRHNRMSIIDFRRSSENKLEYYLFQASIRELYARKFNKPEKMTLRSSLSTFFQSLKFRTSGITKFRA